MATALASKLEMGSAVCVNLFLQCALTANGCHFEPICYEFLTQAFIVYEDQLTNSKDQFQALELMLCALRNCNNLSPANYDTLATKATQYSSKLLKKKEQCQMVAACAHLFWQNTPGKVRNNLLLLSKSEI